ncbi:MAG: oligosaccharide flippase family protein, partial [Akkermansiaceae bacterium]
MTEWQKRFWATTASGYVALLARMILGLVMFRLMFENFSAAQFGFWALLWSLFGYGILLDFGFGFTAQKAVASKTATGDHAELNRLLATIFWTFVGLAIVLLTVFLIIRGIFLDGMKVVVADRAEFESAYLVFFIGLAVMFPLGLFPEILRGLQRIDIANWVSTLSTVLNFGFLWYGMHAGWGLAGLMAVSVATTALPNLIAAFYVFRRLRDLSLMPPWFDWRTVRSQMGFSIAAYLITFSNLLMGKSDQLVISLTLGVALVAIYQAGFKASEILGLFSSQLQQALSPAAASMHALGDKEGLRKLLFGTSKLTFLLVTPCYLLAAVYLEPLIGVL